MSIRLVLSSEDENWANDLINRMQAEDGGIDCPEGYIFKDENGNVINATKIVLEKKKKEYPKTYKEFVSLVKRMREAQKVYSETFPTGYGLEKPCGIGTKG